MGTKNTTARAAAQKRQAMMLIKRGYNQAKSAKRIKTTRIEK